MVRFFENYLPIRHVYPRISPRPANRLEVTPPKTQTELDYRDLFSEANVNYWHREYSIALENYLELRNKILIQSHPEMPALPRGSWVLPDQVQFNRIAELSRRHMLSAKPGTMAPILLSDKPVIQEGEFPVNQAVARLGGVGVDPKTKSREVLTSQREAARTMVVEGDLAEAAKVYDSAADNALTAGDAKLAAELTAESAVMLATYAEGQNRPQMLRQALRSFNEAEKLFSQAGDPKGSGAMESNIKQLEAELAPGSGPGPLQPRPIPGPIRPVPVRLSVLPKTVKTYQLLDGEQMRTAASVVASRVNLKASEREVGVITEAGNRSLNLSRAQYEPALTAQVYNPRVAAVSLEALQLHALVQTNFVAYIPHLFFFTLPVAIGETYHAMGQWQQALAEYQSVLAYPFLNRGIEATAVWLRMAKTVLAKGDQLYRQENPAAAKAEFEKIILTSKALPNNSVLYQHAALAPMKNAAGEVVKLLNGQPHGAINPTVQWIVIKAYTQLTKIKEKLNYLGLGADDYPVFRFKFLQAAANYMADNAIQAERTFINFRTQAEAQKLERIQLESSVEMNQAALKVEQKRMQDAELEVQAATQTRQLAEMRADHTDEALDEWNTKGWELSTINAALSWASNAANDQDINYTGIRYRGETHNYSGDVEDFYDKVGEWAENLNFEMQRSKLERAKEEAGKEKQIAGTREAQAKVRREVQQLNVKLAEARLAGSQEMLEYATDRMFDEDLWFKLANEMQDLAREYLDMAIYSAFLMERAYELEFDRNLNRIRLDYSSAATEGLLGGDHLKRDIASFTIDYLQHAQKKNPVRLALSLREEFPSAYNKFLTTGVLPFRTDLEIFDRRFPGTYRRKLKKIEVFVEGLVPLEGATGTLHCQGISAEWRKLINWVKVSRAFPAEQMPLSSYQFRRDFTVFQPSEEMLGAFENLGPQCNWTLELPLSANNLDFQAVSDVKFVVYFDAEYSPSLRDHLRNFYPDKGGKVVILSSRFHFPDQYFRMEADRQVAFQLHPARFAYNYTNLKLKGFSVRLIPKAGQAPGATPLTITRQSDNSQVNVVTLPSGHVLSNLATMAPFDAWKGTSPAETYTVAFGDGADPTRIDDVQLTIDYEFVYRADAVIV